MFYFNDIIERTSNSLKGTSILNFLPRATIFPLIDSISVSFPLLKPTGPHSPLHFLPGGLYSFPWPQDFFSLTITTHGEMSSGTSPDWPGWSHTGATLEVSITWAASVFSYLLWATPWIASWKGSIEKRRPGSGRNLFFYPPWPFYCSSPDLF